MNKPAQRIIGLSTTQFAYLLLTGACLFWAGNFVMGRGVSDTVPPMALSFWRWLLASLLILPFAWHQLKKDAPRLRGRLGYIFLMGFLGGTSFNALTYLALHTTTATNALVLNAANAVLIVLANFFIRSIRPPLNQIIAILIAMAGMLYIITEGDLSRITALRFNYGDLLVVASMIGWSIYTALLPDRPKVHWLSFTAAIFLASTILLLPMLLIEHLFFMPAVFNEKTISAIFYAAIFPGCLAYIFYNKGVEIIGGNRAGIMIYLVPLFGALLAILFLDEQPALFHVIGFALIITGVGLSYKRKKPPGNKPGG
jgi:drug/metabolite transporter (DMT)-like permease